MDKGEEPVSIPRQISLTKGARARQKGYGKKKWDIQESPNRSYSGFPVIDKLPDAKLALCRRQASRQSEAPHKRPLDRPLLLLQLNAVSVGFQNGIADSIDFQQLLR